MNRPHTYRKKMLFYLFNPNIDATNPEYGKDGM